MFSMIQHFSDQKCAETLKEKQQKQLPPFLSPPSCLSGLQLLRQQTGSDLLLL